MRPLLLTLLCLFSLTSLASQDWWERPFSKDNEAHYYVGVSDKRANLKDAKEEAYLESVKEAVRHNFGFNQKLIQNFYGTLKEVEMSEHIHFDSENISLKGITPIKEKVIYNDDNTYTVYRQIKYPLSEISKEKIRLKTAKQTFNTYSTKSKDPLSTLKVTTNPKEAEIILVEKSGNHSIKGTGDAIFNLPVSRYHLTIIKPGFVPIQKDIVVGPKLSEIDFKLEPLSASIEIEIEPKDATIYVNSRIMKKREFKLPTDSEYTIRFEHPDYHTQSETLAITTDEKIVLNKKLRPKNSFFSVISTPSKAEVYLDGTYVGKTPIHHKAYYPGRYKLEIKYSKKETYLSNVRLRPNKTEKPIVAKLKKESKPLIDFNRYIASSYDYRKRIFSYTPLLLDKADMDKYNLLGFSYDYFYFSRLSLGSTLIYHVDSSSSGSSQYDPEDQRVYGSLGFKIWPIRNSFISLGVGVDYDYQNIIDEEHVNPSASYYQRGMRKTNNETHGGALSIKALKPLINGQKINFGISAEYKRREFKKEKEVTILGIYFEF